MDQHFVFAIRYNSASIPVDPTRLIVPGNPECKPAIVNSQVAIFKFKVTECGTHSYVSYHSLYGVISIQYNKQSCYLANFVGMPQPGICPNLE